LKYLFFILFFLSVCANAEKDTLIFKTFVKSDSTFKTVIVQSFDSVINKIPANSTIANVLQKYSSVNVKSYSNSGLASISLRGTGASHTAVFYETLPLNSPMNGQLDFNLLPVVFFDKMHLTTGNASLKNTIGGIGGSIELSGNNYIKRNSFQLTQTLASYKNYSTSLKAVLKKNQFIFDTRLYYQNATNNFKYYDYGTDNTLVEKEADNSAFNKYGGKFRGNFTSGNLRSFIDLFYFNAYRELTPSLNTTSDENQQDAIYWAINGVDLILSKFIIKNRLKFQYQELIYQNPNINLLSESKINQWQDALTVKYLTSNTTSITASSVFDYTSAFNESYTENKTRLVSDNKLHFNFKKNQWTLDIINRMVFYNNNPYPFIPYIGVSKSYFKNKTVTGINLSKNLHLPTLNDLYWNPGGNNTLLPEQAISAEIYVKQKIFTKKLFSVNATIQGYYGEISNWILWHPVNNVWQADNIKNVENKGLETYVEASIDTKNYAIGASLNYTYNSVINKEVLDNNITIIGKQLIYVPFHTFNTLIYYQTKTYSIEYNLKYTGKRYITTDNSWYLPANYINNISIKRNIHTKYTKFEIAFNIENLFDQPYQMVANRPMPGRNFLISLKINL
jgi:iron complex outermembrane receptor protein